MDRTSDWHRMDAERERAQNRREREARFYEPPDVCTACGGEGTDGERGCRKCRGKGKQEAEVKQEEEL